MNKTPWPCSSTWRYCGPCRVFEQFGDVNPPCCRTRNFGLTYFSLRLPASRSVTHPYVSAGRGNRCLRSAGSAITNATPERLKSDIQDSPGAHCRQCLRGTGWRLPAVFVVVYTLQESTTYSKQECSSHSKLENEFMFVVNTCNTPSNTAAGCNTLQHTATHCISLQHSTERCNTLQYTEPHCSTLHNHSL